MTGEELSSRILDAAVTALADDPAFRRTIEDLPGWTGNSLYGDARAVAVAVLRVLAEVAPGTPGYAVEFDFDWLADSIEVDG